MTDSVAVFPPGYRLTDSSTGEPISGATISFYNAGTTAPKTVYADKDLLTALGTSVTTDSLGCPTSDGSTKTDVFVGTEDYKITIADAADVVIETKDNRPGATVSASSSDVSVTATFPVVSKSANYSVLAADQNTTFAVNCSSGDVTLTLPSAVTVGTGWKIKVQHAGSANQALIAVASASGQTISEGSKSFGAGYALTLNGEDIEIASDGGNWRVASHTSPFIKVAQGIIPITSQVSTSPGSPVQGALYLLTGTGGSFSTFAANDIAQYTSVGWVNFTPYTDCGWRVYVADEDRDYQYVNSAWIAQPLSTPATQSTMEAATAGTPVTADMQQFHPASPKCWLEATVSGGTPTLAISYNITSISDVGTGILGVTIATDFSSSAFAFMGSNDFSTLNSVFSGSRSGGGSLNVNANDKTGTPTDPSAWNCCAFGDQ